MVEEVDEAAEIEARRRKRAEIMAKHKGTSPPSNFMCSFCERNQSLLVTL